GYSAPHLIYFKDAASAHEFVNLLLEGKHIPEHIKFMDSFLIHQINRVLQKRMGDVDVPIIEEKYSLLIHFDSPHDEEVFLETLSKFSGTKGKGSIQRAPDHAANYIWNERFSPLKIQILGPSLLASEVVLPLNRAPEFINRAKIIGKRYKVDLLFESHIIREESDFKVLMMTMFTCDRRKILPYLFYLSLIPMITRLGVKLGGRPYGIGIWNVPFFASRFPADHSDKFIKFKSVSDPDNIMNPRKFTVIKSRFYNIPAKFFEPVVYNISMDLLLVLSPLLGKMLKPISIKRISKEINLLELCSFQCTNCGNCIAVCPAYMVTGHEGTAARGKLRLARRIVRGRRFSREEAERAFLCTFCGACEGVCQTELPLLEAWRELEFVIQSRYSRPEGMIRDFIDRLSKDKAYLQMIESEPY
ncbi:MAG: FAD-linked oxidase C-terminal domain-containing protein, partial [Fidelibacterota bacterium]